MAAKQQKKSVSSDTLKEHFIGYVEKYHQFPDDVLSICDEYGIEESDFYAFYESVDALNADVWQHFMIDTINVLKNDPQYASFIVREQLLAFYYTHLEILGPRRDFIRICDDLSRPLPLPNYLKGYKVEFNNYSKSIVEAGIQTGEIADRKLINKSYLSGLWVQLIFVVKFWMKDGSAEFENTDAAIEKAVNLSAEIVRPGPLDSIVDFAKFIYQNRRL